MDLEHPVYTLDAQAHDPHAEASHLRSLGRCVPIELPQGVTAWITTDDATAREVLTHPTLVKRADAWRAFREGRIRQDWPLMALAVGQTMLNRDGADHSRLRTPVARAFGRKPTQSYGPKVAEIAEKLLGELAAEPPGAIVDLKARFCHQLPMQVICHLLGVSDDMRAEFGHHVSYMVSSTAAPEEIGAAHGHVMRLLEQLAAEKEAHPADDLATRLVQAHTDGELTRPELLDSMLLLVMAGHDTTVNLTANAVHALLSNPDQLALIREGTRTWADAVQEALRYDPPVQRLMFRFATEDMTLGGAQVHEGDPIAVGLLASGRDPQIHADPDAFDVTRDPVGAPLWFGLGAHYCMGAALARMEVEIALGALFAHYPDLALADKRPPRVPSQAMNGWRELPVVLRPAR